MTGSLQKKLRLQRGQKALILNAPNGFVESLGELPEGVRVHHKPRGLYDYVQMFVASVAELHEFGPRAILALKEDTVIWFCYPKKSSGVKTDINRDKGWDLVTSSGLQPVMQVSIDDTWSALRFRLEDHVGK